MTPVNNIGSNTTAQAGSESMTESAARRHILYLCFEFPPISGPAVWRALGFTKYLSENGYDVTLLCSDRSIGWSDKYDGSLLEEIPPEIRIRRIPSLLLNDILAPMDYLIRATKNRLMLKVLRGVRWRVYGYYPEPHLLWAVKATFYGLYVGLLKKVDCIITSGPPHISHIAGYVVSRFTRSRWIIDYRDLWTDEPFISPQAGYQAKLFQAVERRLLKSADAVTTVSPFLEPV